LRYLGRRRGTKGPVGRWQQVGDTERRPLARPSAKEAGARLGAPPLLPERTQPYELTRRLHSRRECGSIRAVLFLFIVLIVLTVGFVSLGRWVKNKGAQSQKVDKDAGL